MTVNFKAILNHNFFFLIPVLFLFGCTQKVWVGKNPNQDMYECIQEANKNLPPAFYNATVGVGHINPSFTNCYGTGHSVNCIQTGGGYVPPAQVVVDANKSNRDAFIVSCMYSKGNTMMDKKDYNAKNTSINESFDNKIKERETKEKKVKNLLSEQNLSKNEIDVIDNIISKDASMFDEILDKASRKNLFIDMCINFPKSTPCNDLGKFIKNKFNIDI